MGIQNIALAVWTTEFQAIDGTYDLPTSTEELQTETDFLVESSLLRTPGRRKKDTLGGESYEGARPSLKNSRSDRTLPSDQYDLEKLIDEGVKKGKMSTTVSKIETYIGGMGEVLDEVAALHHDRLTTLEDNLEILLGMVQTV